MIGHFVQSTNVTTYVCMQDAWQWSCRPDSVGRYELDLFNRMYLVYFETGKLLSCHSNENLIPQKLYMPTKDRRNIRYSKNNFQTLGEKNIEMPNTLLNVVINSSKFNIVKLANRVYFVHNKKHMLICVVWLVSSCHAANRFLLNYASQ